MPRRKLGGLRLGQTLLIALLRARRHGQRTHLPNYDISYRVSRNRPLVVLNWEKASASREIFSAAHEAGHLVMHEGTETGDKLTEAEANAFASALLLPARSFRLEFPRHLDWNVIFEIKRRRRVSAAAIVRRAYDLGLLGAADYRKAYKYIRYRGWHKGEPFEPDKEHPEIVPKAFEMMAAKGHPAANIARDLGWRSDVFERVAGVKIAQEAVAKVTSISDWRRDPSQK